MLLLIAAIVGTGPPSTLAEGVHMAAALDPETILFGRGSDLFIVDAGTGLTVPWVPSWSPADGGWEEDGGFYSILVSPDGARVFLAVSVYLPEVFEVPEGADAMRSAFLGIIAGSDGSGAMPVLVGMAVGGGPFYAFTSDPQLLAGSPMFDCEPSPVGYSELLFRPFENGNGASPNAVDAVTGEPVVLDIAGIGDCFRKCPYSDFFSIGNNCYGEYEFGSFDEPGVTGTWRTPAGHDSDFRGWVLPDAVLLGLDGTPLLLSVDGSTVSPALPFLPDVRAWLPDGSYILAIDGKPGSLHHALVDWESGEVEIMSTFETPSGLDRGRLSPMPGSAGVFFVSQDGELIYLPLGQPHGGPAS